MKCQSIISCVNVQSDAGERGVMYIIQNWQSACRGKVSSLSLATLKDAALLVINYRRNMSKMHQFPYRRLAVIVLITLQQIKAQSGATSVLSQERASFASAKLGSLDRASDSLSHRR